MNAYVVLAYKPDLLGRLARRTGLAHWTHAALRYEHDLFGKDEVIESAFWGVRARHWYYFTREWDEIMLLTPKKELPTISKARIVAYAHGSVGKPYAFLWLLEVAWQLLRRGPQYVALKYRAHICSSLVYDSYRYVGIELLPEREDVVVTPDELASSPLLTEVDSK